MREVKDSKEIFEQEPGDRPATPYFLVYVMDELKEDLVDSVCRNVVEPPPEEPQDTEMGEYEQGQETQTDGHAYRPVNSSMDNGTVESYNNQAWTQSEPWVEDSINNNSIWNHNEAHVCGTW